MITELKIVHFNCIVCHSTRVNSRLLFHCAVLENIHTPPTEGIGISWGVGGSVRPKNIKKCMKLDWNFHRGGGVLEKFPSVGEVLMFSGLHIP